MATVRDTLTVRSGDVRLAVYLSGPRNAPPVILVHGYPDSARVWERVREHLDKRFRVIAYDVRGAGASDAPKRRADYKLSVLAQDLLAVADVTCGDRPFHLVGHDWGSIQCWEAATDPAVKGRLASYTSISGPCLDHVSRAAQSAADAQIVVHRVLPSAARARARVAAGRREAVAAVVAPNRAHRRRCRSGSIAQRPERPQALPREFHRARPPAARALCAGARADHRAALRPVRDARPHPRPRPLAGRASP
ncbi:alpha/beta fold hydrolase [Burkholderia pseudomallei]|uniref:alpha/beta fold hydrolase n=1 Tax=Burkholderia pseudomallei TaxID=28450 RepID=UPI000B0B3688